jgi:adenylate cyclase
MEIERKFLINEFPDMVPVCSHFILQGYLSISPEVRIRSMSPICPGAETYTLTVKSDGDVAREEIEIPLTREQFHRLQELVPGTMIHKEYRKYKLPNGTEVHCSRVDKHFEGTFMYAEVEFSPVEDPWAFVPPEWFGEDITMREEYKMKNYWKRRHAKCASTNQEK